MGHKSTRSRKIFDLLRQLKIAGTLEPWQEEVLDRAIGRLRHADRLGDADLLMKAVHDLCRALLRAGAEPLPVDDAGVADDVDDGTSD